MAHLHGIRTPALVPAPGAPRLGARDRLFKADHPRAIDRYIDYFGGAVAAPHAGDQCGERLLDQLA